MKEKGGRVEISKSTLTLDGSATLAKLWIYNDYVSSLVHELIHYLTFVNYDKKVHFNVKKMNKSDIKSKEQESDLGNYVLAINLIALLLLMVYQLFKSFNEEPIVKWHYYFNIIGYGWGLIFVSIFLFFTIKNLINKTSYRASND